MFVKDNTLWKNIKQVYLNVAGSWRKAKVYVKKNGFWSLVSDLEKYPIPPTLVLEETAVGHRVRISNFSAYVINTSGKITNIQDAYGGVYKTYFGNTLGAVVTNYGSYFDIQWQLPTGFVGTRTIEFEVAYLIYGYSPTSTKIEMTKQGQI